MGKLVKDKLITLWDIALTVDSLFEIFSPSSLCVEITVIMQSWPAFHERLVFRWLLGPRNFIGELIFVQPSPCFRRFRLFHSLS